MSFFTAKLPEKAKKIEFFLPTSKMVEDLRRTFYHLEDMETFDAETETGIIESQEATDDFIGQQKSANTNKKTAIR